jgi:hypothetical protein
METNPGHMTGEDGVQVYKNAWYKVRSSLRRSIRLPYWASVIGP